MFALFTYSARKVLELANREAQRFADACIGAEHILLGVVREDTGIGATALKNVGVDLQRVRQAVEERVRPGREARAGGKLPFGQRARRVTEYAIEEARNLGHRSVGTEHLLLGMLRDEETVVEQVFASMNVERGDVRAEVLRLLGVGAGGADVDEGALEELLGRHGVGKAALELRVQLKQQQENAAGRAAYERAAEYRDMLREVETLMQQLGVTLRRDAKPQAEEPPAEGGAARES